MVRINRVYTRKGDHGETSIMGKSRLPKDHPRIEAIGTIDELNGILGVVVQEFKKKDRIRTLLVEIQNDLFNLGAELAVPLPLRRPDTPVLKEEKIVRLEKEIDRYNKDLPPLRSFVLPGGGRKSAYLHLARTVCRRAERRLVTLLKKDPFPTLGIPYLNRLGDLLFVLARYTSFKAKEKETLWEPGR